MKTKIRILHLEDDPTATSLVQELLETAGTECTIRAVKNREEFVEAMEAGEHDLILADYGLPGFDGMTALTIAQERAPDVPFILVSGALGEELAIEALTKGATDYVLKQRMSRLVPAVHRALREAEMRRERKRLEQQFIQSQKMEVVGHLAGGIAHDFNNILGVIIGYCDLLMGEVPAENELYGNVAEIRQAADRATALTRQLLIFSRKQTVQAAVVDLNEALRTMDKMLRRLIGENIELAVVEGKNVSRIMADPGYVSQIVMNLVVNARDAMPKGGKITIKTFNAGSVEKPIREGNGEGELRAAGFSVSDTGIGMTDKVKARLFEPFFTTKPEGKGTGLGLATCQTVVKQCGGRITVESEFGKGTFFCVYFPAVNGPVQEGPPVESRVKMPRGEETILLVEDEPSVRNLACTILRGQGYEVVSASNGQEGLRVARGHTASPIHLVITDVVMPHMSGVVMAEWLKATYPDVKVLFTSGHTDDVISLHGALDANMAFLPKPYTPGTLACRVREVLDGHAVGHNGGGAAEIGADG